MLHDLRPYPAMKDSGVPWLGLVPEHWDVRRLKYLLQEQDARSDNGNEQLLRVSQYTGVTERRRADGGDEPDTRAASLIGYKKVAPQELVVNIMLAWNGSMGVSQFAGITSPAYCVYDFQQNANPWYFHHLLRSPTYKARIKAVSTGVVESRLRLYTDDLYRLEAILPPPTEQAAIVRFLDYADRRIRKAIAAKQRLIRLLQEQKQVIIHQAVTRGLDPDVKLKPSGVEWLGDVPEGWEVKRLKSIARIRYGLGQPPKEKIDGLPLIRATNVDSGKIVTKNLIRVDPDDIPKSRDAVLREGEIIVVRSGAYTADSSIIPPEYAGSIAGYDMVVNVRNALPEFVALALLASYIRDDQLITASMRSAQPHLNVEELGSAIFLLPSTDEQGKIVFYISKELFRFTELENRAQSEISLLREYRTRLIADVVTGKLDVREAAARLPEPEGGALLEELEGGEIEGEEGDAEELEAEGVEA